jgi:hypothetical protein
MKMDSNAIKSNAGRSGLTSWILPLTRRNGRSGNCKSFMKFMTRWELVGAWFKNI